MVRIRAADATDAGFLEEMLVVAADWREDVPVRSVADIKSVASLAHYVADWPRAGDVGVIAEAGTPVGAAWWRFFDSADPGYGLVDAAVPEVSIGVARGWRGQGIGEALMRALIESARAASLGALSLSVEPDNYAVQLYERIGFETVGTSTGSLTMLLRLDPRVH